MHASSTPITAIVCLFLAACQTVPPGTERAARPGGSPGATTAGLATVPDCADGATATLQEGVSVGYLGSDPDDPHRCLLRWADRSHSLYFGFWSASPKAPMSDAARAAFRSALTGPVGTAASFETERANLWDRVTVAHVANPLLDVAGKLRPALELSVVLHDAHGRPDVRAETRYTIDRATGVLLRRQSVTPMANGEVATTTNWQVGTLHEAGHEAG